MINPSLPHRINREVILTPRQLDNSVRMKCYPGGKSAVQKIIGYVLIGGGILLFLLFVPTWAWLAAIGIIMILLGVWLISD